MSEQDKQEAKVHAQRAGTQAKNAARNTGRAAKATAAAGVDAADDFYDAAKDRAPEIAEDVLEVAEDAAQVTGRTMRRINFPGVAVITGDMAQGFMALTVAIWAGSISANKFASAFRARKGVVR